MGAASKTKYTVVLAYWTRAYATVQVEADVPFSSPDHSPVWEKAKNLAVTSEWKLTPMEPSKLTVFAVREGWDSEKPEAAREAEEKKP